MKVITLVYSGVGCNEFDVLSSPAFFIPICHHFPAFEYPATIGHVTNLSALDPAARSIIARKIAAAGVAVTVLPATDLFLMGRDQQFNIPRGVTPAYLLLKEGVQAAIATNNILNPFTPFGDASLGRMANLYANIMQLSRDEDMDAVFHMVGAYEAKIKRIPYGLAVGALANVVILDARDHRSAIRSGAETLAGWKAGRKTFVRPRPQLLETIAG